MLLRGVAVVFWDSRGFHSDPVPNDARRPCRCECEGLELTDTRLRLMARLRLHVKDQ